MKAKDLATLQSMDQSVDICTKNMATLGLLPEFADKFELLTGFVKNMHKQKQIFDVSTEGYTKEKNESKTALFEEAMDFLTIPVAYAKNKKDYVMLNMVLLSENSLVHTRENKIADVCKGVLKVCTDNAQKMAAYGMTTERLAVFLSRITDFEQKLLGTPEFRGIVAAARASFGVDMRKARVILKEDLDSLVGLIKKSNPELYKTYFESRKVQKPAVRKLSAKGRCVMADTGDAVPNVSIEIVLVTDENHKEPMIIKKRSTKLGNFQEKNMEHAKYIASGSKGKLKSTPVEFWVVEGETAEVVLVMC